VQLARVPGVSVLATPFAVGQPAEASPRVQ
jgi:hypothetical protein